MSKFQVFDKSNSILKNDKLYLRLSIYLKIKRPILKKKFWSYIVEFWFIHNPTFLITFLSSKNIRIINFSLKFIVIEGNDY